MNTSYIYHIASKNTWNQAKENQSYRHSSLDSEGFIHCSTWEQLLTVANHHYKHVSGLVVLKIETLKLTADLVFEGIHEGVGQDFPHLYGELNLTAVEAVYDFPCLEDGTFVLPENYI